MPGTSSEIVLIFVTVPTREVGHTIARALLDLRLVACVNILPAVESIFHWKGEIETAEELLLILKSKSSLFDELQRKVTELHPYETPEIICTSISAVSEKYRAWVLSETK